MVRVVENHLPLTALGLNPARDFEFFYVKKLSSLLKEHRWFYSWCPLVPEIMNVGLPPAVKLESRHITLTVLVPVVNTNKKNYIIYHN